MVLRILVSSLSPPQAVIGGHEIRTSPARTEKKTVFVVRWEDRVLDVPCR